MYSHVWSELRRQNVFKKYSRSIDKVKFKLPDESEVDFYIKSEGVAVCILALTDMNEVILVRQFRPGPQKILDEMPGGSVESGEKPADAIRRELKEETGYEGEVEFVGTCLDDAYSTMVRHCFVAKICNLIAKPEQVVTETIEVILKSIPEFREQLRSGQLTDAEVGYLALDHLGLL